MLSIFPTVNSDGDDNARAGRRTLAGLGLARAITYARSGRINAVRLRAERYKGRTRTKVEVTSEKCSLTRFFNCAGHEIAFGFGRWRLRARNVFNCKL